MAGGYPFFCHLSRLIQSCAARAPFIFWSYAVIIGQTFNPLGLGLIYSIFSYFNVFNGFLTAVQVALLTIYDMCKSSRPWHGDGGCEALRKEWGQEWYLGSCEVS
jgi:hypothetical protein